MKTKFINSTFFAFLGIIFMAVAIVVLFGIVAGEIISIIKNLFLQ